MAVTSGASCIADCPALLCSATGVHLSSASAVGASCVCQSVGTSAVSALSVEPNLAEHNNTVTVLYTYNITVYCTSKMYKMKE